MPPMRFPIPEDWNGQDWRCLQVEWPDSPQYRAVLLGLLSYLTRGAAWAEVPGAIPAAQEVGWEIYHKNYPFNPCAGDAGPCDVCTTGGFGGFGGDCEEDDCEECGDMACISAIKIEDGKLYVQYGCCDWVLVGEMDGAGVTIPDLPWETPPDPNEPPGPPSGGYSACGKARAVIEAIWAIGVSNWNNRSENLLSLAKSIETDTGLEIKFEYAFELYAFDLTLASIPLIELLGLDMFKESAKEKAICRFALWLKDDANGIDGDTFKALKSLMHDNDYGNRLDNWVAAGYWELCTKALGQGQANSLAKAGAINTAAVCDCPDAYGQTPPPFELDTILYDVIAEMEVADCTATYNDKVFNGITAPASYIRGNGETDTTSNRSCDLEEFDTPMLDVLAGDEVWILPSLYHKGPTTNFNFELGITLHRTGGDTEVLELFGDRTEIEALPGSWTRLMTLTGDPAQITRVYGGFKWWADGEGIDFKIVGLVIMRPA